MHVRYQAAPLKPWEYDREMYKRRNEVEGLFRRLKGCRRIFSRFEKLDAMFLGFQRDTLRKCIDKKARQSQGLPGFFGAWARIWWAIHGSNM